ncbi:MAG: YbbR-like domain-containing protein [Polyangiaceae bacterium]|nr:YbbR-like domain-containing protein [Polyangiaceae bacterium]
MSVGGRVRDRLKGLIVDNFWLKLFSLVCSLGLYAFIHGAESAQRTVEVDVVVLPAPPDRQLLSQLPTQVAVILQGPRTQLDALRRDAIGSLQIDLRSGRGSQINLDAGTLTLPTGVRVSEMYPSSVETRWDDIVQKEVQIQVSRTGEPAPGLMVKGVVLVEPVQVTARGPRSMLNVMQLVRTVPFDVSGLAEGVHKRQLALDRPPSLVSYESDTAVATVEIARALVSRELSKLPVQVVGVLRATVRPATVTVKLKGTAEDLQAVDPEALVVRVEPKAAGLDITKPGNAYLQVLVDLPKVTSVEIVPEKVYVQW